MARSAPVPLLSLEDDLRAVAQAQAELQHAITRLAAHVEVQRVQRAAASGTRLLTVKQVAAETTLSRSRINTLIASGRLKVRWIDGRRAVDRADFEAFVDSLPNEREMTG